MKHRIIGFLGLFTLLCGLVLIAACDSDSTKGAGSFSISPGSSTLGDSDTRVVLTALGGSLPISWSVSDTNLGTVSGTGDVVTYRRVTGALGANVISASDSRAFIATATVLQQADVAPTAALTITPTTATVATDQAKVVFMAVGGVEPYSWRVGISELGKVRIDNTSQATYTRLAEGANTVQVTDKTGRTAIAQITQPGTTPPAATPLAVSPSSATVSTNGVLVLTASGGTGEYIWSISSGNGTVSPTSGDSTVFTSTDGAVDVLRLDDSATTVFITIGKN